MTVTCNPAVDVTYVVPRLTPGEVHRVETVHERPGGKGVNVARVLRQLEEPVVATGLADEHFGAFVERAGVPASFVPELPSVRRTVVVHSEGGTATGLWEPGRAPQDPELAVTRLLDHVDSLLERGTALVVSGSLPVGVGGQLPLALARLGHARAVPVVLDLDGDPLQRAAEVGGSVLVPNLEEFRTLVGRHDDLDVAAHAREVSRRTGSPVVVTLGSLGILAAEGEHTWHARPPSRVVGNPTGAGDAAVAAIVRGMVRQDDWSTIWPLLSPSRPRPWSHRWRARWTSTTTTRGGPACRSAPSGPWQSEDTHDPGRQHRAPRDGPAGETRGRRHERHPA